jgi:hypothetical protein
MLQALFRDFTG